MLNRCHLCLIFLMLLCHRLVHAEKIDTYLVEEISTEEDFNFNFYDLSEERELLASYDASLKKEELALSDLNRRKIYKSYSELEENKKNKLLIDRHIIIENCYIGLSYKIFEKSGKLLFQKDGPIDLRKVISLEKSKRSFDRYKGYSIDFKTASNKEDYFLVYNSERKRNKVYDRVLFMSSLCADRFKLARKVVPDQAGEGAVLKKEITSDKSYEHPFDRPLRTKKDERNQRAALLTGGEDAWKGRLYLNQFAKNPMDQMYVQTLIFMADEAGIFWSDEFIEKRKNGVDVQILIDALSSFLDIRDLTIRSNTPLMYNNLMAAGIPVYGFRCLAPLKHRLLDELKVSEYFQSSIYNQRPHEKIWVAGDMHVIVGGLNVGNDYFRLNKEGYGFWRDQDVLLKSKALTQDFVNIFKGNVLSYEANYKSPRKDHCFNPYDPINEKESYESFYRKHFMPYKIDRIRSSKKKHQTFALDKINLYQKEFNDKENSLKFHSFKSAKAVHNRPKLRDHSIEKTYLELIDRAEKELIISNSYFIPSLPIKRAIRRAARRGVKVIILTNSYESNDVPPVAILGQHAYKELVDESFGKNSLDGKQIEIYEWTGRDIKDGVLKQGTNHAKFLVADRKNLFIGSYNLDPRSRDINSEVGAMIKSEKLGRELAEFFFKVDLQYSKHITYEQMLQFRQEPSFLETAWLKLHDNGAGDLSILKNLKRRFFYHVAKYDESTW